MGRVINNRSLLAKDLMLLTPPVILCVSRPDFDAAITESGYVTFSLNLPLAKLLSQLDIRDARLILTEKIQSLIPQNTPVFLVDYEMLFNPQYELDVIRLFTELARRRKLIVKWSGQADSDSLTYAQQGYADYKRYRISDYNVVAVK